MRKHGALVAIFVALVLCCWIHQTFGFTLGVGNVQAVAYSPDGKWFAVSENSGIWLYDAQNLDVVGVFKERYRFARTIDFSPDGRFLVSGGIDHVVWVWDVKTQREVMRFRGHQYDILSVAFMSRWKNYCFSR